MPAAPVQPVNVLGVQKMRPAKGLAKCGIVPGNADHMNMVGHQAKAVHPEPDTLRLPVQQFEIDAPVVIDEEHVLPVIAPLRNMMRRAWDDDTCNSGHADRI